MTVSTILAGVSTIEAFVPVVEKVGAEIGPLVETELADGKVIWGDVVKAFNDFKATIEAVKAAVPAK